MHLGTFYVKQGFSRDRKSGDSIFFPRIFSGSKWKTGKCREFQESKTTEWLKFRSSALSSSFLQVFGFRGIQL
jgi:hypothetical protein